MYKMYLAKILRWSILIYHVILLLCDFAHEIRRTVFLNSTTFQWLCSASLAHVKSREVAVILYYNDKLKLSEDGFVLFLGSTCCGIFVFKESGRVFGYDSTTKPRVSIATHS